MRAVPDRVDARASRQPPSSDDRLRRLSIGLGLCWAIAFVVVGTAFRLQLYGDGALFSYAVAAEDVWAFHWHNISARLSVFLLSLWPAEIYVGLTGNPHAGITLYGLLFYGAPLAGLLATRVADRSRGRTIFAFACASTALLCPLVFGFPTEMWWAHALFWPTLAACYSLPRGVASTVTVFALMLALLLTHEGALVLALAIVATLAPRGWRDHAVRRSAAAFLAALAVWAGVKIALPPGSYFAGVLERAALHFFDPDILSAPIMLLLMAALAAYFGAHVALRACSASHAVALAVALTAAGLAAYWLVLDHSLHASERYYLRTAIVVLTPLLGASAVFRAELAEDAPPPLWPRVRWLLCSLRSDAGCVGGALLIVTLIHLVETAKFVTVWSGYKAAVRALATGTAADPMLGDPHFVSSSRIDPSLNRLAWFSTTQYLGVVLADFAPTRLVIDPNDSYFWLSCATATANAGANRVVPARTRELIRTYVCQHRH